MLINAPNFKQCLSKFATGIVVVTTSADESDFGVTINSFNSVSLDPPLILFSIKIDSIAHERFTSAKHFAISILSDNQLKVCESFINPIEVVWSLFDITRGAVTNSPIITGALGYLECSSYAVYPGGDHSIIVGRVLNLESVDVGKPLLYFDRRYATIP